MLPVLTIPELTGVFLGVVVSLGAAVVWLMWEFEEAARARLAKAQVEQVRRRGGTRY